MRARSRAALRTLVVLCMLLALLALPSSISADGVAVPLRAGCTSLALSWPAGTALTTVAAAVTPRNALVGIWRHEAVGGRQLGFAPGGGVRNEYRSITAAGERATVCVKRSATLRLPDRPAALSATPDRFYTLPPGAVLPEGNACAGRVRRTAGELRPGNAQANRTHGTSGVQLSGVSKAGNASLAPRVDGAFSGTTDEIQQWAACKWGMNEEIVRAMAWQESAWRQTAVGRKQTYGILQIKPNAHPGTFPHSRDSTAFNVDYGLGWWRACYEGYVPWVPATARGDAWGCVGLWFSGRWRDADAERYITLIKRHTQERPWARR